LSGVFLEKTSVNGCVSSDKTWFYQERGDFCEVSSEKVYTFVHSLLGEYMHKSAQYFFGKVALEGQRVGGETARGTSV
jgi:hypothetical protein